MILSPQQKDLALQQVSDFLIRTPRFREIIASALRQAFDEVIDGPRTGRYRIEQLEKTEKTYIGTKVEIVLRNELQLHRGALLDNLILGYEVDTKFSLSGNWMIPSEAIDHLCILVMASDNSQQFSVGLLRMSLDFLTQGSNKDGKKSVSAFGKSQIHWLINGAPMIPNFLLSLQDEVREQIMSAGSGVKRVAELFRTVTFKLIPRSAIEQVAQQKDPLRRARQMKAWLASEGLEVLCATYANDREKFISYGFRVFRDDDWLCIKHPVEHPHDTLVSGPT